MWESLDIMISKPECLKQPILLQCVKQDTVSCIKQDIKVEYFFCRWMFYASLDYFEGLFIVFQMGHSCVFVDEFL